MKKLLIWIVILAAVAAVFYLVQRGVIRWQPLTVLVAALLAPFKFISGLFGSDEEKIRDRHRQTRAREAEFQTAVEAEVQRREQRVESMHDDVQALDDELERLNQARESLADEIERASAEQLLARGRRALG